MRGRSGGRGRGRGRGSLLVRTRQHEPTRRHLEERTCACGVHALQRARRGVYAMHTRLCTLGYAHTDAEGLALIEALEELAEGVHLGKG